MNPSTLTALAQFPDLLQASYAAMPARLKSWRPRSWDGIPSERLTAIEQICHVADIETEGYHVRFARALAEERPVLADIPGELWASQRNYAAALAPEVLAQFKAARAATIATLSGLSDQQLARAAIFENRPTTVCGLIYYLCSHDYQHLAGLQWLQGKAEECDGGN